MRLSNSDVDKLADYLESETTVGSDKLIRKVFPSGSNPSRTLGIIEALNNPRTGITTYCTFGVAHKDWTPKKFPHRLEIVAAIQPTTMRFGHIVATTGFHMIENDFLPGPGTILKDVVNVCNVEPLSKRMPHVLFVEPYCWGHRFEGTVLDVGEVWLLQICPIYEDERLFIQKSGFKAFEEILLANRVPLIDASRKSCII